MSGGNFDNSWGKPPSSVRRPASRFPSKRRVGGPSRADRDSVEDSGDSLYPARSRGNVDSGRYVGRRADGPSRADRGSAEDSGDSLYPARSRGDGNVDSGPYVGRRAEVDREPDDLPAVEGVSDEEHGMLVQGLEKRIENKRSDEALDRYEADVLASRLEDVMSDMDAADRAELMDMILGSDGRLMYITKGTERMGISFGSVITARVEKRFGPEVSQAVLTELVRNQLLCALTQTQIDGSRGVGRFDVVAVYGVLLSDEIKSERDEGPGQDYVYNAKLRTRGNNLDAIYEKDPDLFVDILMVLAADSRGPGDVSDGLRHVASPSGDWNGNYGSNFSVNRDGIPYRPGHREQDVARFQQRLEVWGQETGERHKTREDLVRESRSKDIQLVNAQSELSGVRRQLKGLQNELDASNGALMIAQEEKLRAQKDRDIRRDWVDDLNEANKKLEQRADNMMSFMQGLLRDARDHDNWGKRGDGLELLLKQLERKIGKTVPKE